MQHAWQTQSEARKGPLLLTYSLRSYVIHPDKKCKRIINASNARIPMPCHQYQFIKLSRIPHCSLPSPFLFMWTDVDNSAMHSSYMTTYRWWVMWVGRQPRESFYYCKITPHCLNVENTRLLTTHLVLIGTFNRDHIRSRDLKPRSRSRSRVTFLPKTVYFFQTRILLG